jgi:hypothetical protein
VTKMNNRIETMKMYFRMRIVGSGAVIETP